MAGVDLSGGSAQIANAIWKPVRRRHPGGPRRHRLRRSRQLPAGRSSSTRATGVDQLQFLMATETIPHDKVMSSIEMFGKHVIPQLNHR